MHLLILGATGRTGVFAYPYALEEGHHVTALVRSTNSVEVQNDNLTLVEGSCLSEDDVAKAFSAAGKPIDAVIIILNPVRKGDGYWSKFVGPPRLIADTSAIAARLLRKQRTQHPELPKPRLVVMNALGSGESRKVTPFIFKLMIDYTVVARSYEDHTAVDAEIEGNCGDDVSWTIVLAVGLGGAGEKPVRTFANDQWGASWMITRESCARWMVDVASGSKGDEFSDKRVIVSN